MGKDTLLLLLNSIGGDVLLHVVTSMTAEDDGNAHQVKQLEVVDGEGNDALYCCHRWRQNSHHLEGRDGRHGSSNHVHYRWCSSRRTPHDKGGDGGIQHHDEDEAEHAVADGHCGDEDGDDDRMMVEHTVQSHEKEEEEEVPGFLVLRMMVEVDTLRMLSWYCVCLEYWCCS
jgi:hypothetical protein